MENTTHVAKASATAAAAKTSPAAARPRRKATGIEYHDTVH